MSSDMTQHSYARCYLEAVTNRQAILCVSKIFLHYKSAKYLNLCIIRRTRFHCAKCRLKALRVCLAESTICVLSCKSKMPRTKTIGAMQGCSLVWIIKIDDVISRFLGVPSDSTKARASLPGDVRLMVIEHQMDHGVGG
jgi:hypothetical protein